MRLTLMQRVYFVAAAAPLLAAVAFSGGSGESAGPPLACALTPESAAAAPHATTDAVATAPPGTPAPGRASSGGYGGYGY